MELLYCLSTTEFTIFQFEVGVKRFLDHTWTQCDAHGKYMGHIAVADAEDPRSWLWSNLLAKYPRLLPA